MPEDKAISVDSLSKVYKLYNSPIDRLKEALHPLRRQYHHDFYALNGISFEVNKGETVGIIGKNGSGKSTLLKVITGVLAPTSGDISVNGKVSALLELGAGFNPELSGLENVYFNGMLMGYSREEMEVRLDDILSFADIGEFVHQPVKTYSSGMFVRLAFAVAINVAPDILIVDEALSVGDMFFQAKCMAKMKAMIDSGVTLFFVSHSSAAIKSLCRKALLLDHGCLTSFGDSSDVVEKYFSMSIQSDHVTLNSESALLAGDLEAGKVFKPTDDFLKRCTFQRVQNGRAAFANVLLLNQSGQEVHLAEYNQSVTLRMAIVILAGMDELSYAYHIRDKNGVDVVYSSAGIENSRLHFPKKGDRYIVNWRFELSLMEGEYTISCVLSAPICDESGTVIVCDFIPIAVQFQMQARSQSKLYGLVHWGNNVEVNMIS